MNVIDIDREVFRNAIYDAIRDIEQIGCFSGECLTVEQARFNELRNAIVRTLRRLV